MVETARLAGFDQVIGFDMGGTSTDVAHYDGEYERAFDTEVAGVRVRAPMMRIHTVAAGGGSILHFEAGRFRVGPDSAGANPGPACYRRGGPLAVTDANVMLGKLQPDFFPAIFGPGQDQPLDTEVVREKFAALAAEIGDGDARSRRRRLRHHRRREHGERHQEDLGAARLRRDRLSAQLLRRRWRPARLPGGRRARHAIGADPPLLRPAVGLRHRHVGRVRLAPARLHPAARRAIRRGDRRPAIATLADAVFAELGQQGVPEDSVSWRPTLHIRYDGTDTTLPVNFTTRSIGDARKAFEAAHKAQFGFIYPDKPLVIETVEVQGQDGRVAGRDETDRDLSRRRSRARQSRENSSAAANGATPRFSAARR